MIDLKRAERLRTILNHLNYDLTPEEKSDLLTVLDSYIKTITPASPDSMSGHDEETNGPGDSGLCTRVVEHHLETLIGGPTASPGPSTPDERRAWDGEQPLLVRFDEATEWVVERAKTYRNDWIWQERLKAVEIARSLLLAPAPAAVTRDDIEEWIGVVREKYRGKKVPDWWAYVSGAEVAKFMRSKGIEVVEAEEGPDPLDDGLTPEDRSKEEERLKYDEMERRHEESVEEAEGKERHNG